MSDTFIRIPLSGILIKFFLCALCGFAVKPFLDKSVLKGNVNKQVECFLSFDENRLST